MNLEQAEVPTGVGEAEAAVRYRQAEHQSALTQRPLPHTATV